MPVKSEAEISQNIVSFKEYMNFTIAAAAIATPPPVIQLKCIKTLHSAAASFLGLGLNYGVRLRLEFQRMLSLTTD